MAAGDGAAAGARVGLVLVSHSAGLARDAADLARAMAPEVKVVAAGGVGGDRKALGTDANLVAQAVDGIWSEAGVLVLMDLGSAVLSAELALDLIAPEHRPAVRLSPAPLVEGAVAAAVAAQIGGSLAAVEAEARSGLLGKQSQLGEPPPAASPQPAVSGPWRELLIPIGLPLGLHARPAALLVQALSGLDAEVRASNPARGRGPVSARSLNSMATLQVGRGQALRLEARGPQAEQALQRAAALAARDFDEPPASPEPPIPAPPTAPPSALGAMAGLAASPGLATGPVVRLGHQDLTLPERPPAPPAQELALLERALAAARTELTRLRDQTARRAGAYQAGILDADLLFLDDPELSDRARGVIAGGEVGAAAAWKRASDLAEAQWTTVDDPQLRLRAADLHGVNRRVLGHLLGRAEAAPTGTGVLVAEELNPADTAQLDPRVILGIATAGGGPTSHSAILARSLGIPAVVGLGPALLEVENGTKVLLDGDRGTLEVDPTPEAVEAAEREIERRGRAVRRAAVTARRSAVTRDGVVVEVAANIGSLADARAAVEAGADGVGLLRTEFLFQDQPELPDAEAQFHAYLEIAEALEGRPLTIRTLDVGADKPLPSVPRDPEENPALGVRGLRLGLSQPELLVPQLAAIVRVAASSRVRVMFPMVATREEVTLARRLLAAQPRPPQAAGTSPLEVGIMVEVPAAALAAAALVPMIDFMSVGTNDLSQYTLAADRGNAELRGLADPLHPSVLRLIWMTARAGGSRAWVGVCGELAGDPAATELLVGLGVRELSAAPRRVAAVKEAVRKVDAKAAAGLAEEALSLPDADAVRELLARPRPR